VGGSSSANRSRLVTTDNSFLKVALEQGLLVGAGFFAALVAAVILLARRLRAAREDRRALGLAALAGFVAFLGVASTGEYFEQPGKVIAWGLFGIAAAVAFCGPTRESVASRRKR
jgi:hypothetical protein